MTMQRFWMLGYVFIFACLSMPKVYAVQLTVSIPPLAGIVAPILLPEDSINVLLKNGASPHGYQLKPSDLITLKQADLRVVVGSPVDAWAQKALKSQNLDAVSMLALNDVFVLPKRNRIWQAEPEVEQGSQQAHDEHPHHEAHNHDAKLDGHLWLSHQNAILLVKAVNAALQTKSPEKAAAYQALTDAWLAKLAEQKATIQQSLNGLTKKPYIVLHDAYQYFEHDFGLQGVGALRLNPEIAASVQHLSHLREQIQQQQIQCIFKEPQFPEKTIRLLSTGLAVQVGQLDPMGTYWTDGAAYLPYDQHMQALANEFKLCLGH